MEEEKIYKSILNFQEEDFKYGDYIDKIFYKIKLKDDFGVFVAFPRFTVVYDAICNYNNDFIFAKYNYCFFIKYKTLVENIIVPKDFNYNFWMIKFCEQTINVLYSLHEKNIQIIKYIYDKDAPNEKYLKNKLFEKVEEQYKEEIKKTDEGITEILQRIRHNSIHNMSDFLIHMKTYREDGHEIFEFVDKPEITYKDGEKIINKMIIVLRREKNIILKIIKDKFKNVIK